MIKNSPGCRRNFRVKMWGTSSPDDELTGDFGNVIEATQIGGRRLVRLIAGNLSPGNFRLLQHNLPISRHMHLALIPRLYENFPHALSVAHQMIMLPPRMRTANE